LFDISSSPQKENADLQEEKIKDRRIQKTKKLLHEALGFLIREKAYDEITVQEILDRANVGRSTFYMHFRDKDELLVSSIHEMLRSVSPSELPLSGKRYERIIRFARPIFERIHHHRNTHAPKMGTRGRAIIHEHLHKVLAGMIADDVRKELAHRKRTGEIPADLLVQYLASTFILVLNWWVESRHPLPPDEIHGLFRTLVLPTLAASWE
jgi:AcrR family transcriptional regulator